MVDLFTGKSDSTLTIDAELECVGCYKYLGIIFTAKLCWTLLLQTSSSYVDRVLYTLKRVTKTIAGLPVSSSSQIEYYIH